MTKAQELFHKIASELHDVKEGKMFGALCIKAPNGKAGVMFWKEYMIFKLGAEHEAAALSLKDTKIFEPMDGRPMGGWVQVPYTHAAKWKGYAEIAMEHVRALKVEKKKK